MDTFARFAHTTTMAEFGVFSSVSTPIEILQIYNLTVPLLIICVWNIHDRVSMAVLRRKQISEHNNTFRTAFPPCARTVLLEERKFETVIADQREAV